LEKLKKVCEPCRVMGRRKFGKDVCYRTGGECQKLSTVPPITELPLSMTSQIAMDLFHDCESQWYSGMNGATGINYSEVARVARSKDIDGETFDMILLPLIKSLEEERLDFYRVQRQSDEETRQAEAKARQAQQRRR